MKDPPPGGPGEGVMKWAMEIGAGTILRGADADPINAWHATFYYDLLSSAVVSTLPTEGGIVAVATVGSWFFSDQIVDFLLRPAREAGQETLYFSAPMEAFLLKLKASVVVGILVGFPLILQRIYMFVLPGLLPREKRVVTPLLFASTALFYVGVLFCFLILLPLVIRFAVGFATEYMQPWLTVGSYFSMAARLCLAFGLLFELPMVVFALSWAGVVFLTCFSILFLVVHFGFRG